MPERVAINPFFQRHSLGCLNIFKNWCVTKSPNAALIFMKPKGEVCFIPQKNDDSFSQNRTGEPSDKTYHESKCLLHLRLAKLLMILFHKKMGSLSLFLVDILKFSWVLFIFHLRAVSSARKST